MEKKKRFTFSKIVAALIAFTFFSCSIDKDVDSGTYIDKETTARSSNEVESGKVRLLIGLNDTNKSLAEVISEIENDINTSSSKSGLYRTQSFIELERVHSINKLVANSRSIDNTIMSREEAAQLAYNNLDSPEEKAIYRDFKFQVPKDLSNKVIELLKTNDNVTYVQKDNLNILYDNPNDTYYRDGSLWGLNKTNCGQAWDVTKGENVVVAVIDSGVDGNHPDLVDNLWRSPKGTWGYDFSDNDNYPSPSGSHGTHVAGTVAAVGNNGRGVIGVAPNVKIMALKIFPNAYSSVCADAIRYAVDNGAKVLNNSWGPSGRDDSDPTIENAIRYAHSKEAIVIFAAGNSNDDARYYYGGNSPYTICVAAVDSNFNRASFSNYGSVVDISAPGVSIKSTVPNGGYSNKSGTSMASPHIAGLAALILSKNPAFTYDQVLSKMKTTAIPVNASNIGAGVMDAYAAVRGNSGGDNQAPTIPGNVVASDITTSSCKLSWSSSTDNVGVTGYKIYADSNYIKSVTGLNTDLSNMSADTTYQISITAVDAAGNESQKNTISVKTLKGNSGGNTWKPYTDYTTGDIVTFNGVKYQCRQSHPSLPGWEPAYVPALWAKI